MQTKSHILAVAVIASCLGAGSAEATPFTPADTGLDVTYSLGQFKIVVEPSFGGGTVTSPVMFDNNTQIQRTYVDGSHVNTQVLQFDMQDGLGMHLTAGGAAVPGTPASFGTVVSNGAPGFTATSTFNMYVNVNLPSGSFLYNPIGSPLSIINPAINSFPPDVVYIHNSSNAVPVYLHVPGATIDALYGYLTLAGHGVLDVNTANGTGQTGKATTLNEFQTMYPIFYNLFDNTMTAELNSTPPPLPNPLAPATILSFVPLPATLWLFGIGLASMAATRKHKQAA